ncbi:hypothetical protein [Streptomyces sp. NPDC058964]|uniref:hypothetical protein n=1 Tax=Streptomyces sp. NPDC058964 TaxID=3346681 RepID=UPI00367F2ABA
MRKRVVATSLAAAALTVAGSGALAPSAQAAQARDTAAACTYRPTSLPVANGVASGTVTAVAGGDVYAGTVSARVNGTAEPHAALWSGGAFTDLGTVPGGAASVSVNDVNGGGVAVGSAWQLTGGSDEGWPHGVDIPFRTRDGKLEKLPVPAGADGVVARAITENGDIYGDGFGKDPNHNTVYLWPADKPGTVTEPAGFPVGSVVAGVDKDGTVAVTAESDPDGTWRPYVWKDGVAKALPLPAGAPNAAVTAISNGRVVGHGLTGSLDKFAVLWDKDGSVKKLSGGTDAVDINAQGLILGFGRNSLWQLTTPRGGVSGAGSLNAVAADSSLVGSASTGGDTSPRLPAVWRCG